MLVTHALEGRQPGDKVVELLAMSILRGSNCPQQLQDLVFARFGHVAAFPWSIPSGTGRYRDIGTIELERKS